MLTERNKFTRALAILREQVGLLRSTFPEHPLRIEMYEAAGKLRGEIYSQSMLVYAYDWA